MQIDISSVVLKFFALTLISLPFTLLRIGMIGIPETCLLCIGLLFMLLALKNKKIFGNLILANPGVLFFVFYLFFCVLGNLFSLIWIPPTSIVNVTMESILFDYMGYIFSLYGIIIISLLYKYINIMKIHQVFSTSCIILSVIILALYITSLFSSSFLSLPLVSGINFSPLAMNLHHVSMVLLPMSFFSLYFSTMEDGRLKKKMLFLSSIVCTILAAQTGSTKALMGLVIGYAIISYMMFWKKSSIQLKIMIIFAILASCLIFNDIIVNFLINFFVENDGGGARENLYTTSINYMINNFFIGIGAGYGIVMGAYIYNIHSSLLTSFFQGGILGGILFLWYFYKMLRQSKRTPYLLAVVIAILLYGFGGDILRRLPIWIFLTVIYYETKNQSTYHSEFIYDSY